MTCAFACQACDKCWAALVRSGRAAPTVAEQRAEIEARLCAAAEELTALQAECEHAFATSRHRRASGYDYEHFWVAHECADCGKRWTVEQ